MSEMVPGSASQPVITTASAPTGHFHASGTILPPSGDSTPATNGSSINSALGDPDIGTRPPQSRSKVSRDVDPWEVCNRYIRRHTDEFCESWRDEIDKLLIFAGLFSGVVTSFSIESYHAVKEDPAEQTVLLLKTIVRQLDNMTHPQPISIDLDPSMEEIPASAKRINVFWFISLSLSLTTVMAGIVCLQWIREYERSAHVSHREDVALYHMRHEGLHKWHVHKILSALPLLLIAALVLFFAGFIELLWEVDQVAAILVTVVVGIAFFFILLTTILPTLQYISICVSSADQFTRCPYKSPQAWMVQWIFQKCVGGINWAVLYLLGRSTRPPAEGVFSFSAELFRSTSWRNLDTFLLRRRKGSEKGSEPRDIALSLAWVGETFVQDQKLVEAVSHCLRELDPTIALEFCLASMTPRRAKALEVHVRRLLKLDRKANVQRKRELAQDLIISQALDHLSKKIEPTHLSSNLLCQRLELFSKVVEEETRKDGSQPEGVSSDEVVVDCPVHLSRIPEISQEQRGQILQCITKMLEGNWECNETHTKAAYEILRSSVVDKADGDELLKRTLDSLFLWIKKDPTVDFTSQKPEKRLRLGIVFAQLRCKGGLGIPVAVQKFQQELEDHIKTNFGEELKDANHSSRAYEPKFPFLLNFVRKRRMSLDLS